MSQKIYTTEEAAKYLGVHPNTIKYWKVRRRIAPDVLTRRNLSLYSQELLDSIRKERGK